ncbi:MAG: endonuclease III [bacterium]|nr:endonuclease III [bacterium]MDD4152982.1 endonuclease III [bacterium]
MNGTESKVLEINRRLVEMYGPRRWLPRYNPLDELIYTILSQNTTDVNSLRAFERLRQRFPCWEDLIRASLPEIEKPIAVGGLSAAKAVWIRDALKRIRDERGELSLDFICNMDLQRAWDYLISFKGVGVKTAAIVLLFSCGRPVFPVDTHVYRVSRRLGLVERKGGPERAHRLLQEMIPPELYYQMHINMVQHGRQICRARNPLCSKCLLRDLCRYYLEVLHGENGSRF